MQCMVVRTGVAVDSLRNIGNVPSCDSLDVASYEKRKGGEGYVVVIHSFGY